MVQGEELESSDMEVGSADLEVGSANRYSPFPDTTIVNPLTDHLVSYATMWYEYAARDAEYGEFFF